MGEAELSRFVTCRCQHCGGHIEFDATALDKEEKRGIECPHCRQTTVICAPTQSFPESQSKKLDRWEFKRALPLALIFVIAVGIAAFFLLKPKFSEKLQTDRLSLAILNRKYWPPTGLRMSDCKWFESFGKALSCNCTISTATLNSTN